MERDRTIVFVILAAVIIAAAGCAWYFFNHNDQSNIYAGDWKATYAYGYDSDGRAFEYDVNDSDLTEKDIWIIYEKDNLFLLIQDEMAFTGISDNNALLSCFGTETGKDSYYATCLDNVLYVSAFVNAGDDRTILWSIIYTRDRVMPEDAAIDDFDLTESWEMVSGTAFTGTSKDLNGSYFEFTSFNGNTFMGLMKQDYNGTVIERAVKGCLFDTEDENITCEARFMDIDGNMWRATISNGKWMSAVYLGAAESPEIKGVAVSVERFYTPNGTEYDVEEDVVDLSGTVWNMEWSMTLKENGDMEGTYDFEYAYSIHFTAQQGRQLVGYVVDSGMEYGIAAFIVSAADDPNPVVEYVILSDNLYDYGFIILDSDVNDMSVYSLYEHLSGACVSEYEYLVKETGEDRS
jgi:hypothetical protein